MGIGVLTTAAKADMADSKAGVEFAQKLMTTLNRAARDAMVKYRGPCLHGRNGLRPAGPRLRDGAGQRY
jgi:hypothetical protein